MSTKTNKKNVAADALLEMENIKSAIKEESKNTISALLKEEVKNYLREAIDDDDDDEKDYEIQGGEEAPTDEFDSNDNDSEESGNEPQDDDTNFSFDDNEEGEDVDEPDANDTENGDAEVPEGEAQEGDEGLDLDQYKVDGEDGTYDLTGVKDYDEVVKVFKRLDNDDKVLVKKEGNKVSIEDREADTEYVIDLGGDDENTVEEPMAECYGKSQMNENKKNRKEMKENRELVFEIDLGYTDNYQKNDPIEGLSNNEPAPNGAKTLDQGIPTGTEKPWAKDAKSKSDPYGKKTLDETDNADMDSIMANGEQDPAGMEECNLEEGGARTPQKKTKRVKSTTNNGNPQVGPVRSPNSNNGSLEESKKYRAMTESLLAKTEAVLKENKELRNTVDKIKQALQESLMVNTNLGKVTKLFMENTTTQKEKIEIVNRFNDVKTFEQSNALYETISRELKKSDKQALPLQETSMTVNGSAINETKLYESQDLLDVKSFMKRMENC